MAFQVIDDYPLPPGCCYVCRAATHKPVVDLDKTIDEDGWEGHAYICSACVEEMADSFGWVAPEKYTKVKTENSRLRKQNASLKEQFDGALTAITEMFTPEDDEEDAA